MIKTGQRSEVRGQRKSKSIFHLLAIVFFVSVITWGIFYGILAECDLRELKANKATYNRILTDRAMAQYYAERQWSR